MKSRQQLKAQKAIDIMFYGLDDPILKQALLTAYSGEDPKILEAMKEQEKKDMEEILANMELQNVNEAISRQAEPFLTEDLNKKSNEIVDGNS